MKISEQRYKAMPPELRALFAKLPNHGSDEVVGLFPETTSGSWNGQLTGRGSKHSGDWGKKDRPFEWQGDTGSAARFFYTAKAGKAERGKGNNHPTVKPLDLMAYLCRLVTPPGGTVLDPFCGSGTTLKAALSEGFSAIGIEKDAAYFEIIESRMNGAQLGLGL
jgi:site-specific DNA-methyltransferase (adenine-specific)